MFFVNLGDTMKTDVHKRFLVEKKNVFDTFLKAN